MSTAKSLPPPDPMQIAKDALAKIYAEEPQTYRPHDRPYKNSGEENWVACETCVSMIGVASEALDALGNAEAERLQKVRDWCEEQRAEFLFVFPDSVRADCLLSVIAFIDSLKAERCNAEGRIK